MLADETDFAHGHETVGLHLGHDGRVSELGEIGGSGRDRIVLEAGDRLGEDLHVALAAPFPIGDVVEAGPFLHL